MKHYMKLGFVANPVVGQFQEFTTLYAGGERVINLCARGLSIDMGPVSPSFFVRLAEGPYRPSQSLGRLQCSTISSQ